MPHSGTQRTLSLTCHVQSLAHLALGKLSKHKQVTVLVRMLLFLAVLARRSSAWRRYSAIACGLAECIKLCSLSTLA